MKKIILILFIIFALCSSANAASRYVNFNTSSGGSGDCGTWGAGNDSTGDGSISTPWATVKKALEQLSGWEEAETPDYIVIKDGETRSYQSGDRIDLGGGQYVLLFINNYDGEDSTNRLYIVSEDYKCGNQDYTTRPEVDFNDLGNFAGWCLYASAYLTIDGIEFHNNDHSLLRFENSNSIDVVCTDVHISNCKLYDTSGSGSDGISCAGAQAANWTATFEDNWIGDDTAGIAHSAIYIMLDGDQTGPITIRGNKIWNFAYTGIDLIGASEPLPTGFLVEQNLVFDGVAGGTIEHGIVLRTVDSSTVRSNVVYGLEGRCISLHGGNGSASNEIYNNVFYSSVTDNGENAIVLLDDGSSDNIFKNNIFVNISTGSEDKIACACPTCGTNTFDYNYYYGGESGKGFSVNSAATEVDFDAWKTFFGAGTETNGAQADPLFKNTSNLPDENDPAADGLTLGSASPCIDAGIDLGAFDGFLGYTFDDYTPWAIGGYVDVPVVTITATDAAASEEGPDTGTFRMTRGGGGTSGNLVVSFTLGGTAGSGDYDEDLSGGTVTILDGNSTVDQTITPTDDSDVEGQEILTMTIAADSYVIGSPSQASITIADNEAEEGEVGLVVFGVGGTGAITRDAAGTGSFTRP